VPPLHSPNIRGCFVAGAQLPGHKGKPAHHYPHPAFGLCRANLSRDALRTLWHVLSDPQSDVSQQIDSAAREALCRMHAEHLQSQAQQTSGSAKLEGPA
jgi:uncharacterized membrane protein